MPFAVHDERHAAVRTVDRRGALAAEHRGREAAAVQQHERLLAERDPLADRIAQPAAEDHVRAVRRVLLAYVHYGDGGERTIEDAALEDHAVVLAGDRVVVALHRRRRRAEDDERTGAPAADDRDVAPVVARNLLLLVRRVVLLVDDDEADALERRKDGRARADDDVDVAAADALPLIVALAVAEAAVLNGDAVAERRAEERRRLRRERDLRDQHQDAASGIADGRRE